MSKTTILEKPIRRRRDSGEIDVFEATRYFSGNVENLILGSRITAMRKDQVERQISENTRKVGENIMLKNREEKKIYKQPSSPGAKLASFLNSMFLQSKKKSKSLKDEEGIITGRGRRLSISHSQSIRSSASNCTTKGSYAEAKYQKTKSSYERYQNHEENNRWVLKRRDYNTSGYVKYGKIMLRDEEEEEGEDDQRVSDASSDLFELKNYDLGDFSANNGGLPVYGTTNMKAMKREAAAIATASF